MSACDDDFPPRGSGSGLPATLALPSGTVTLRGARTGDVAAVVALLRDDFLGAAREAPNEKVNKAQRCRPVAGGWEPGDLDPYIRAFEAMAADPRQLLVVAEEEGVVVATMQVLFLPGMTHRGAMRAQLEAVRVAGTCRGRGIGRAMIAWVVDEARRRGCRLVQLTTDKTRTEALGFYLAQGFAASHEGLKLML